MAGSIWERFTHDPRHEQHGRLRASDSDRDIVNDVLGTAYAEGRLTPEELDERSDQVARAKTLGELPAVMDDLVAPTGATTPAVRDKRAEAERRYRQQRQQALFSFLTPTLICWVIWLYLVVSNHGTQFPWPVFVTIGTGMRFFQLATGREDTIASIERDLEKKERKRLEDKQRKENKALPQRSDEQQDSPEDS
ncbi:MAG: hypothetical protein JWR85_2962 [Marmoricola sp.]|nr:hypothetical protein [Marmoricola sp.]